MRIHHEIVSRFIVSNFVLTLFILAGLLNITRSHRRELIIRG